MSSFENGKRKSRVDKFRPSSSGGPACWLQLVAKGVMNAEINASGSGAAFFWKQRYMKTTHFSMTTSSIPFEYKTRGTSDVEINKSGDVIPHMYLSLTLPGIVPDLEAAKQLKVERNVDAYYRDFTTASASARVNDELGSGGGDTESFNRVVSGAEIKKSVFGKLAHLGLGATPAVDIQSQQYFNPRTKDFESSSHYCYWTNAVGQACIDSVTLTIGSMPIDSLCGEFMFIWDELTETRSTLEMVGKRYSVDELIDDSRRERILYVPLPFFFNGNPGSSLCLASLAYNAVKVSFILKPVQDLIVRSHPSLPVLNSRTGDKVTSADLDCRLMHSVVHLDTQERETLQKTPHSTLIRQLQRISQDVGAGTKDCKIPLTFQHPVSELFVVVRAHDHEQQNKWLEFADSAGDDPIENMKIVMNNMELVSESGEYFRTVQPYQHHSNIPSAHVYCWSFAIHPEKNDPTGSCNFSRIDSVSLELAFSDTIVNTRKEVLVFARSFNKLNYRDGTGSSQFLTTV